ncbi:MAG: glycerol-3-phosphate 1-O-acyltransferase PlsY [Candidatus Omnitrophica bacterium]|nr:glycerol-3-phosphate 1-O-acyltransferase PlsY [Candidatus Omnitrophota bacterium]
MMLLWAVVTSYLMGSIPTAYLFGKYYKGIDIRKFGSGNVGATNAIRVLGKKPGVMVLLIDIIKGIIPLTIVGDIFALEGVFFRILLGVAVVVGHNWTIFLQFKGGKGIATSFGVLIGLTLKFAMLRPVLLMGVFSWAVVFLAFGYVSLASIFASTLLPILMLLTDQSFELIMLGVIFCVFVVVRHRPNIKRLLAGKEPHVSFPFQKNKK